jgi:hypothetical protein
VKNELSGTEVSELKSPPAIVESGMKDEEESRKKAE